MKISKIKIIFFFLFYAGQSHAQSDRTRLEIDTDKGCKYAEFVTSDRIQIRKQLSISWTGYCENGYISGEGTLTLKGIEADTTVIKTTFSNGLENGQGESKNESPKGRSFFIGNWKDGMRTNGMLEIYPQGASPFKYEGEFSDGKYNGFGKFTRDGTLYEGSYKNGIPDGKGKWIYPNGNSYEGEIKENKLAGKGIYKYANGTVIEGSFLNGSADGYAKASYTNGDNYEGNWVQGNRTGKGKYFFSSSGNVYEGEYLNNQSNGKGKLTYKNSTVDEGEFVNGLIVKGTRKYADGGIDEGEFKSNKLNGKGIRKFPNGGIDEGEFIDGILNGRATIKASNGDHVEGFFKDGKLNGQGKIILKNGTIIEGEHLNGELTKGKIIFTSGQIDEGTYSNRKLNGKGKIISPNGVISEGNYVDGKPDGLMTITSKDGQRSTVTYSNGVVVSQNPPTNPPASPQQQSIASQNDAPLNFDDAKRKCLSIGFKEKSEQFGKCVLQLSK
jgi:hypothetical protein